MIRALILAVLLPGALWAQSREVRPGELFEMAITTLRDSGKIIKQSGTGSVGGELAVEAEWLCIAGEAPAGLGARAEGNDEGGRL